MLGSDDDFYKFYEKVIQILRGIEAGEIKIESVETSVQTTNNVSTDSTSSISP